MLFQSLNFIFVFFPVTLVAFLLLNKRYPILSVTFLIFASLVFCGYNDLRAAMVIVGSAFFNYFTAFAISKAKSGSVYKTSCLVIGIAINFLVLFWYKFFSVTIQDALIRNDRVVNSILEVSIPLGLSFYTLYQISLLVDSYQDKAKLYDFRSYLLSLTMFAHLPAGPILRYKTSIQQFAEIGKNITEPRIAQGMSLFTFGLFKKTLLADPLSIFTDQMFVSINSGASFTFLESLLTVWGFLLQLYFDFSAYSDMAIGLGLCFGLKFPVNFNSPLKAISFSDYISRWHISLIAFNREYIFLPVSKLMLKLLKSLPAYKYYLSGVIATMIVYISIGFWHSPTLQFLFSGALIGLILTMSQIILLIFGKGFHFKWKMNSNIQKAGAIVNQLKVLLVAGIIGSLLRLDDLSAFRSLLKGFINFNNYNLWEHLNHKIGVHDFFSMIEKPIYFFNYQSLSAPFPLFILFCSILALRGPNSMEIFGLKVYSGEKWRKDLLWKPNLSWGVFTGFCITLYLLTKIDAGVPNNFLYGQF